MRALQTRVVSVDQLVSWPPHPHIAALLDILPTGVMFTDMAQRVRYLNMALAQLLPGEEGLADWLGAHLLGLLRQLSSEVSVSFPMLTGSGRIKADQDAPLEIETQDGRTLAYTVRTAYDAEHRPQGHMWVFEDVTPAAEINRELLHLADHDALTGLYNRRRLQEDLKRALLAAERTSQRVALLVFDLDHFKDINDRYGHGAGDALLSRMADEVAGQIRRNETLARLGGDEFAILVPDAAELEVKALAERIVKTVSGLEMSFDGHHRHQTCSVGVAFFPEHARSMEELLECADAAMYRAKESGRNQWRIWHERANSSREERSFHDWEVRIDHALDHGLLRLHVQGAYDCASSELLHLEALVRLQDGDTPGHLIQPGSFLPIAVRNGRIRDIDHWVVQQGIQMLRCHPGLRKLAIKLSATTLAETASARFILDTLQQAGVAPQSLILEVSEEAATTDLFQAQRFIHTLHAAGCGITLERFGSGFASFSCLRHLDADVVKIDDLFVRQLAKDPFNQACVKSMVDLAHGLGKKALAGRVEDAATHSILRQLGVDTVQGYFFDRPSATHPILSPTLVH
jgi:diguanylate cyclase (GGDEF)-like protein